jgi:hypothetical protein
MFSRRAPVSVGRVEAGVVIEANGGRTGHVMPTAGCVIYRIGAKEKSSVRIDGGAPGLNQLVS